MMEKHPRMSLTAQIPRMLSTSAFLVVVRLLLCAFLGPFCLSVFLNCIPAIVSRLFIFSIAFIRTFIIFPTFIVILENLRLKFLEWEWLLPYKMYIVPFFGKSDSKGNYQLVDKRK